MTKHDEQAPLTTGRRGASELDTAMMSAHRKNIARYQGLLESALSADERRYVERRVAEEQAALRRISRNDVWPFSAAAALP
ncbi:MAG TPA: hypothetical protein VLX44_19850 [Xanthobacteraceae bacterium]|nr:hypothetical protein [Xanthobacteraceae bacterium]